MGANSQHTSLVYTGCKVQPRYRLSPGEQVRTGYGRGYGRCHGDGGILGRIPHILKHSSDNNNNNYDIIIILYIL